MRNVQIENKFDYKRNWCEEKLHSIASFGSVAGFGATCNCVQCAVGNKLKKNARGKKKNKTSWGGCLSLSVQFGRASVSFFSSFNAQLFEVRRKF